MQSSRSSEPNLSDGPESAAIAQRENAQPDRLAAACPSVSVVICSYSEARWSVLAQAVSSVEAQTHTPYELLIVVDHNDGLRERARDQWPDAVVMANAGTRGLASARNTGVEHARGDIVAFLDDDAIAEPAWLGRLAEAYGDPTVMAAGGAIEPVWPERRPWWFPDEFDGVVGCTYRGMPIGNADVRNVIGANMSFRRDVLGDIGGFRDDLGRVGTFPAGCEETELCIRAGALRPDQVIRYWPAARVDHVVAEERTHWSYYLRRCYQEGRSKSIVASLSSSGESLDTERSYVLATLPRGVGRGVADVFLRRDPAGLARAVAIVFGLGVTSAGFGLGRLELARRRLSARWFQGEPA